MRVTLYLADKLIDFKLPNQVSGSFSFDYNHEEENKLINIVAREDKWVIYETTEVSIISGGSAVSSLPLIPNQFYIIQRNEKKYLIHISEHIIPGISVYSHKEDMNLMIGNINNHNIKYNIPFLNNVTVTVRNKANSLVLERTANVNIYVNKYILNSNAYIIKNGDEIEIYGLRMMFLNGLLLVNKKENITVNEVNAKVLEFSFPMQTSLMDKEIKDIDLYSKDDYYSKSPRLRRQIETKMLKLSAPPKNEANGELPLILVIGPMITMGVMSITMLVNTIMRLNNKQTTMEESWPQLVTSAAMLITMLLWPLVTQAYNKHRKRKKEEELTQKYNFYLDEKRKELFEELNLQREILYENLIPVEECIKIINNRNINFWDKRIDQNDFLVTRLGIGREFLDAKIDYPDEGFTIDESELQKKADELVDQFKYIEKVPVSYSFYENKETAIMGQKSKVNAFVNNIILQLITFYGYEDLKIGMITNGKNEKNWEYLRYLNHSFNNDKSFRFFATDKDSIKNMSEIINIELNRRISQLKDEKRNIVKPHYLIIIDDYDKVKHYDFIKTITELEVNLGFSLIILEERLSKLPSKCNNFIIVGSKNSGILKNSYENQTQTNFEDEINYDINMLDLAKKLSNIPIEFEEDITELPEAVTFLEMEKVGKTEQLNILNRWNINDSTTSLRAEIGVDEQGELMYLDLHEKYHGPHGLIAGMTGSGKSEFIITYILSLAINYSPDDVAFVLIDYKGGGLAYAFENKTKNITLPHLAGTITNLDKAEMDRTLVSIDSEIKRRQHLFNEARDNLGESTIDIYKYQTFYKEGKLNEPVPHLFIICDEFAELKSQQPEFMDNLISVARIGRSLGVHLILATQKPSGVVNDQIWSNTKFRVCLKVQDELDSREMLKRTEAASLKQAGRFYLQVGFDEYFALGQSGWCGAKYYPSDKIIKQVDRSVNFIDDNGNFIKSIQPASGIKIEAKGEQLSAILDSIIEVSNMVNKKARRLWLDNISETIVINDLENKYIFVKRPFEVKAIVGEYDAPERQEQGLIEFNYLENGNTIIYGMDGSDREMLLSTLIYSSAKNHTAEELNYYIIDYGSESLRKYQSLPHFGGMVFSGEEEKYNNLLKLLKEELRKRKKLFTDFGGEYKNYINSSGEKLPLITIIINNYDSVYDEKPELYDELPEIIRDSERYGMVFIITGNGINSVQNKVSQNCPNLYAFRLKDSTDYTSVFGVRSKVALGDMKARGLINNDGVHEFQTASITDNEETENEFISEFIKEQKQVNTVLAKRIPVLPEIVGIQEIQSKISDLNQIPIGISKKELEIYTVDYLSSLGNIITSNKLASTKKFTKSLLSIFEKLENINTIIVDPMKLLKTFENEYQNYYSDNLEEVINSLNEYLAKLIETKSMVEGVIVIYGLNKFITKIKETTKLDNLAKQIKEYEKISLIVIEEATKIKSVYFEPWFSGLFSVTEGIWIGRGISDQNLLQLSTITREMTKDYKTDMGYIVSENVGTLCKLIDFISGKEGAEDEK